MKKNYLLGLLLALLCASFGWGASDPNFCEGRPDGLHANPLDPNGYYICASGYTYPMHCAAGLIFYDDCKCCEWPDRPLTRAKIEQCFCADGTVGQYYHCSLEVESTMVCYEETATACFKPDGFCN